MGLTPFQLDLRNGMSLEDALKKHNLTLKKALEKVPSQMPVSHNNWRKSKGNTKNIHYRGGNYMIIKDYHGKTHSFGTYRTVEDAQIVRDYMNQHGWEPLDVGLICALMGVERVKRKKSRRR